MVNFRGGIEPVEHSHFMKSECEMRRDFEMESFVPFFMKSGAKVRGRFYIHIVIEVQLWGD